MSLGDPASDSRRKLWLNSLHLCCFSCSTVPMHTVGQEFGVQGRTVVDCHSQHNHLLCVEVVFLTGRSGWHRVRGSPGGGGGGGSMGCVRLETLLEAPCQWWSTQHLFRGSPPGMAVFSVALLRSVCNCQTAGVPSSTAHVEFILFDCEQAAKERDNHLVAGGGQPGSGSHHRTCLD